MAIMAAQGRSLGFSLVFATQDIPAMLRENDKEAKSIIANTTNKIFLRVEELEMTAKLGIDSAGKGMKAQMSGWSGKAGEWRTSFNDSMEARVEMVDRISALDLRALGVGEAYVTWHDQYFKVQMFHAGEFEIFEKVGFWNVFFGDALIGSRLPQLTYMLSFPDLSQMNDLWAAFRDNPEWKKYFNK